MNKTLTNPSTTSEDSPVELPATSSINFAKLCQLSECIISWSDRIIFLIDADRHRILQWHHDALNIQELIVFDTAAYVMYGDKEVKVCRLTFNLTNFLSRLIDDKDWPRLIYVRFMKPIGYA